MSLAQIIVHRGNSPVNTTGPLEQVSYYVAAGFKKIEIDIYAVSETSYKFCHPLDNDKVDEIHTINDGYLEKIPENFPEVEWYIDLKCLDLDKVPLSLLRYLMDAFDNKGVITAVQPEILKFAHKANRKTAQCFKNDFSPNLGYTPDLFVLNDAEIKRFQKKNTVIYCQDQKIALKYIEDGYAGAMVDGNKLITA